MALRRAKSFLVIYIVTRVYNASLTIYDSMLNDVAAEERMDEVGVSYGYAWGIPGILHSVSCSTDCLRLKAGYGRGAAGFCL